MNKTPWSRLLDIQRAGISERTIYGAVALSNHDEKISAIGSDPTIYGRSLMKPFQMKVVARELDPVLDWQEKAIACSSHSGFKNQVEVAQRILSHEDWSKLKLPPSAPLGAFTNEKSIWLNPCSGKHSAVLKACELNGWPTENYLDKAHPYNRAYIESLERILQSDLSSRTFAADGCGLPTFAIKLSELARLFARLARDQDADWIWSAYRRHPELIGGEGRLDTRLMALPGTLAKEGADGLLGIAIRDERHPQGLGVAIKLAHGWDVQMMSVIAEHVLKDLGYRFPSEVQFGGQTAVRDWVLKPL